MKFNIQQPINDRMINGGVRIGDVYPAKGGARRRIALWVVLSITGTDHSGQMVHLLGLNEEGEITSTSSYGLHAMESRERIGYVAGLEDMQFNIEPMP